MLKNFAHDRKDYTPLQASDFGVHAPEVPAEDFPSYWRFASYRWKLVYKFEPGDDDDGVTALIPEKELNELPAVRTEHLVPGYIAEKTERFWRALPKEQRKMLQPFNESLELFMTYYREREFLRDMPFREVLRDYLEIRLGAKYQGVQTKALFLSRLNKRISNKTVQWMVYKYLDRAGLEAKHFSVHKLRHTAATLMYQSGNVDVRVLKDILGHEQLNTTQIYTHVSNEHMKNAMEQNPLSKIKK